ncbi:MAG: sulfate permease [Gammaproteobacteria bacterium]|nr:sodium-independent anion transporter [Gammaproteobacteria bacterium]MDP6095323.1 sulfate permease [Gammaproteobacteria bacterium]
MRTDNLFNRYLPILRWGSRYRQVDLLDDSIAAVVVAIMLIPQSLALAILAGLPAQMGLYASIFGLLMYSFFGTSSSLSIGPVAVVSLMTAAALGKLTLASDAEYIAAALTLTFLCGGILLALGLLRLGFMANFLSHPVISAFITASGILIGASQIQHLLGISTSGHNLVDLGLSLSNTINGANLITLSIGIFAILFILWFRIGLRQLLKKIGWGDRAANAFSRAGPIFAVVITSVIVFVYNLGERGVQTLGEVPIGLPGLMIPDFSFDLVNSLLRSAMLISIIGFVESVSVAQTLATRKRERIDLDQELVGLGAANIASSLAGGFPVTGGFSRSVVNFDAGASTPAAGLLTSILIALAAIFFTPVLYWLPKACLAAIIIVAISSLIDFSVLQKSWNYSRADFAAVSLTLALTLVIGVEIGIAAGVLASIVVHLYKTSKPHVAVVGKVPGTEHYRNVDHHQVITHENILSIRIDESLYFANTRYLEKLLTELVAEKPRLEHVILMCIAINKIDLSALEALEKANKALSELQIKLHLSEVKGPIMDKLRHTDFFRDLSGNNYLSHNQAVEDLKNDDAAP